MATSNGNSVSLDVTTDIGEPTLKHVIEGGRTVRAMVAHGDNLIVVREPTVFSITNQTIQVQVYDAAGDDFTLKRTLTFPSSTGQSWGSSVTLASCAADNSCVFVGTGETVYRVELSYGNKVDTWCSVGAKILAMSSDSDRFLVLTGSKAFGSLFGDTTVVVKQYTKRGTPVSERAIRTAVAGQWHHTVLMSNSDFVVSHSDLSAAVHRVSWLDKDGKVVFVYGGKPGSAFGHLSEPRQLAVDRHGNAFVADSANNRVMMLNVARRVAREVRVGLTVDGGLQEPFSLCLDESRGRLYVGESAGDTSIFDQDTKTGANTRLLVFEDINR